MASGGSGSGLYDYLYKRFLSNVTATKDIRSSKHLEAVRRRGW